MPIYIEMLERWKTEMKKQFEETQDKLEIVVPYEEYHGGGLSIICPHCDTQVAIPECDIVKVVECPVCSKELNISWRHKEKEQ